ncbi:MAG: signal peptidase I [Pseudomonadota bacterium]|nr:signal peptidase I [Pseudomonadota bacterium]
MSSAEPPAPADGGGEARTARPRAGKGVDWWKEIKGIFWLVLAVLAFHSFIAKPFYIPSESMMPILLKGDRLAVSKYPYGWSWVSPSFHVLPPIEGRIFGRLPERGDIVIVTPTGQTTDLIKRVIGLPGDTVALRKGQLFINGRPVKRERRPDTMIRIDPNISCPIDQSGAPDAAAYCRLPVVRETLPNGNFYDTIDLGYVPEVDDFGPIRIPADHVFLMGDNRDRSADSRVPLEAMGLGGPVPYENLGGRAEIITFSVDGSSQYLNPVSWFTALRSGRAGMSLRPSNAEKN